MPSGKKVAKEVVKAKKFKPKIRRVGLSKGTVVLAFVLGFLFGWVASQFLRGVSWFNFYPTFKESAVYTRFRNYITDFSLFWEVYSILENEYVDPQKLDDKKMYYGSIKGLVNAVEDPATVFMDPEEHKEYEEVISGEYEGIGAVLEQVGDYIHVVGVFEGSPAQQAGLQVGDIILEVNGESVIGKSIVKVVTMIRGPQGTQVTLKVLRPSEGNQTLELTITRDVIKAPSMRVEELDNNIVLLRVSRFTADTLAAWLEELAVTMSRVASDIKEGKAANGIIIDLRGNPGGYLEGAIEFLGYFLPPGSVVVYKESRQGIDAVLKTSSQGSLAIPLDVPVVVLVDKASASASEIVAGALQYYKRAYIIGEKTYGKGTVQASKEFRDGSLLKYTVAYWLLPSKERLSPDNPIIPDKIVEYNRELKIEKGIDNQLQEAINYLLKK